MTKENAFPMHMNIIHNQIYSRRKTHFLNLILSSSWPSTPRTHLNKYQTRISVGTSISNLLSPKKHSVTLRKKHSISEVYQTKKRNLWTCLHLLNLKWKCQNCSSSKKSAPVENLLRKFPNQPLDKLRIWLKTTERPHNKCKDFTNYKLYRQKLHKPSYHLHKLALPATYLRA